MIADQRQPKWLNLEAYREEREGWSAMYRLSIERRWPGDGDKCWVRINGEPVEVTWEKDRGFVGDAGDVVYPEEVQLL